MANFNLLRSNILYMEKAVSEIRGEKNPGDSVTTTLNYDLQLRRTMHWEAMTGRSL